LRPQVLQKNLSSDYKSTHLGHWFH